VIGSPTPPSEPQPYRENTQDSYAQWAADTFAARNAEPGVLLLHGSCPQCQANIEVVIVTTIFAARHRIRDWLRSARQPKRDEDVRQPVLCTCQDDHPGRPDGRLGCGAYWTMIIAPDPA
jgi:hypothetical protein